jgi:hypothetical protein
METRVALIGIIVEQESSAAALNALLAALGAPDWLRGLLAEGAYRVLAWACRTGNGA